MRSVGKTRNLASHNGILGHQLRKAQEFGFPFPRRALLYAYSDGMNSRWYPGAYPGLENRSTALIAGIAYRPRSRRYDPGCSSQRAGAGFMSHRLVSVAIDYELDVVSVRQRARQIAALLLDKRDWQDTMLAEVQAILAGERA